MFHKVKIPWWLKIFAKLAISRLPVSMDVWRQFGLFRLGRMDRLEYAYDTFSRHFSALPIERRRDFVMLELGPGDSLLSALFARAHGAKRSVFVDVGPFASQDVSIYRDAADFLSTKLNLQVPLLNDCVCLDHVLSACRAEYKTEGLKSLKQIESETIDWIWSQAVLEHVRKAEFLPMLLELCRVLRPFGVCSHRVDLRDHLGGKLNNLRFRDRVWESRLFSDSGFYTNRIRYSEMLDLFEQTGFSCQVDQVERWDTLPTPRRKLAASFRGLPEECLRVRSFDIILRRNRVGMTTAA